ncbi:MAG: hypothetical protein UW68_C0029G0010 [Candidatus Collierbacteria bacterium GW2011_GWB1_44_6]|uniref:Uncharacterized protein n=2 Tax=Candidatus Collieribacteriota TaxID=1752725 RepID=A0A0G1ML01_9BACT|nr:MAG: hypothetical protein UV68_C0007G0005 [Candidatus Collierbacteria bacterium GW2011_GWC2_43_12]KKT72669.1 MAG: hypothetical protein UW68_C0029G0010 [Candidatus Collierbacteria bacterium GW2011_GWB1_44_6]KKT81948.1 MAG: hypothetical protein UW80_C0044G0005 [Microgenomates group bacterium GW2011_GWC1_44_9]
MKKNKAYLTIAVILLIVAVLGIVGYGVMKKEDTETRTKAAPVCELAINIAKPTPTPTPTPTPVKACNSMCRSSSQCESGLTCVRSPWERQGRCRNPQCKKSSTCVCPTPTPSPTPTPTVAKCENCQYQVDLFYGPVLQSFAGGVRYAATSRLIAALNDFSVFPGCKLNSVQPITPPTVTLSAGCENPIANKYLVPTNGKYFEKKWIDLPGGYVYATITNTTKKCTYDVGLASYKANGNIIDIQNLNDYAHKLLGPGQTTELMVKMPMNNDAASCHIDFEKPAIYLYPETKTEVSVKVDVNGRLTKTDPEYGTGWNVTADPSGLIDGKYDYLFYEANVNKIELPTEGWVVAKSDLNGWLDKYLPKLGLNEKESTQFKEYWLTRLPLSKYFEIKLMSNAYLDENLALDINPKPETVIRVELVFKGIDTPTELEAPEIMTPARKGFVVVEWGGVVME